MVSSLLNSRLKIRPAAMKPTLSQTHVKKYHHRQPPAEFWSLRRNVSLFLISGFTLLQTTLPCNLISHLSTQFTNAALSHKSSRRNKDFPEFITEPKSSFLPFPWNIEESPTQPTEWWICDRSVMSDRSAYRGKFTFLPQITSSIWKTNPFQLQITSKLKTDV